MPVYPTQLPESIRNDPHRTAEIVIYNYFQDHLPEDFHAIYTPEWICNFRRQVTRELIDPHTGGRLNPQEYPLGETDFILVTPRGLLVLEVKGGSVFVDKGSWFSMDRKGISNDIENPILQARKNMYAVLMSLEKCRKFSNRFVPAGYAAILPNTDVWAETILDQRLFVFREHLKGNLISKLEELFGYWRHLWQDHKGSCIKLDQEDIEKIITIFAPTVKLKKQPARHELEEFTEQVLTLTENQFDVLRSLNGNRNALITGGAGTGKTLLAVEKARQTAGHGHRTLFTCPNRLLSTYVSSQLKDVDNLEVMNFHGLCYKWGVKAGIDGLIDPDGPSRHQVPADYYKEKLPDALFDAVDAIDDRFEAIIVDEAQEMDEIYWTALQRCLVEDDPIFYIFCDPDQAIWHLEDCLPFSSPSFHLNKNLRNSRKVFSALKLISGEHDYDTGCTHDGEFEVIVLGDSENLPDRLGKLLHKLVSQGYTQKDIAIVTGKSLDTSRLANTETVDGHLLTCDLYDPADKVLFSSTRQFRGMESMIVIMIEVDYIIEIDKLREELGKRFKYRDDDVKLARIARETLLIGMSRAQHSLFIIADADTAEKLEKLGLGIN